jgi:ADP-heptose:LPS heptosyltransferase
MTPNRSDAPIPRRLGEPPPQRVLILRALQLGDLLCAVPALRAVRAALPRAELVLVGLPWARAFVERCPHYLDGFREFPGYPGLPERVPDVARIPAFLGALQAECFDLALQLHGSGAVANPLTVLFGARRTAGFYVPGAYCPDPDLFLPWPTEGLEIRRLLRLMEFLGMAPAGEHLEFPLGARDHEAARCLRGAGRLCPGRYACIHPGASVPERRWPPERFAAVARALAARGLGIVLTGTTAEAGLTRAVGRAAGVPCLDLAGRTDLGAVAALLHGARLLVCNDTGVSHVAAALRVPSVVTSTGDNPQRWAPTDARRHRVLCRASGVTVREVVAQAEDLLASFAGPDVREAEGEPWERCAC